MRTPAKILTMLFVVALAFGLTACSGNSEDKAADGSTSNTEISADSVPVDEGANEENYVECDGEKMSVFDWSQMISSNPLSMDTYIGKNVIVVSDFQMISTSDPFYYQSYESSKSTEELPASYEAPIGMMVLDGLIYVDIPEADQALASGLKKGDKVKVQGTISGFSYGTTYLFSAGTDYSGAITIEKL